MHPTINVMELTMIQVKLRLKGNCSKGELTRIGQHQAYDLGKWLRERYVDNLRYLPPSYKVPAGAKDRDVDGLCVSPWSSE